MHANFRLHATRIAPLTASSFCFGPAQKMVYWLFVKVACILCGLVADARVVEGEAAEPTQRLVQSQRGVVCP